MSNLKERSLDYTETQALLLRGFHGDAFEADVVDVDVLDFTRALGGSLGTALGVGGDDGRPIVKSTKLFGSCASPVGSELAVGSELERPTYGGAIVTECRRRIRLFHAAPLCCQRE